MSTAKPQQMADQADKSDDLISELAKLMASNAKGGEAAAVRPVTKPAPLSPTSTAPSPIRIPGMEAPAAPAPEPRAPSVGTFRVPGMDQSAPAAATPPVAATSPAAAAPSKFDFGKPPAVAPVLPQESITSLQQRIAEAKPAARVEPSFAPAPRVEAKPFAPAVDLKPAGEARPVIDTKPAAEPLAGAAVAAAADSDFNFDFGFGDKAPAAAAPAHDPIADLIAAEMDLPDATPPQPEVSAKAPEDTPRQVVNAEARPIGLRPGFAAATTPPVSATTPRVNLTPVAPVAARMAPATPIPVKPISVSPSEADRFAISPGIGLNTMPSQTPPMARPAPQPAAPAPQPAASQGFRDPMSEIEDLIGEAVRVEISGGEKAGQVQQVQTAAVRPAAPLPPEPVLASAPHSPVVPPLTTQFAPRRAALRDDAGMHSAEDAILAAAAATGAQVGRIDDGHIDASMTDERAYKRIKVKAAKPGFLTGGLRQYVGMAAAITLLLAAGLGLYWVLGMSRGGGDTTAPVLTADSTPVKVAPDPVAAATDTTHSPVLDQIDGVTVNNGENLVSTDQAEGDVARIIPTEPAAGSDTSAENGLANRKVHTVTVRPDGTIVSGDDAVAGGEALPVDRPNVPAVPGTDEVPNTLLSPDVPDASNDAIGQTISGGALPADTAALTPDPSAVIDPTLVPPTVSARPINRAALAFSTPVAAAPQPLAPVSTPTNPVNAVVTGGAMTPNGQIDLLAPAPIAAAPVSAPAASSGGAVAYVQLYSEGSEGEAKNRIATAETRYGSLFNGQKLVVQRADLGQKGIKFRVRLPVGSLQEATQICASIKANGGDCFATNG